MKILGINFDIWITSACLLENGKIIAACPEERLNRQKQSRDFPWKAINFCLKEANCTIKDIDHVVLGWNPGAHINKYNGRFSQGSRWRGEQLVSVANSLLGIHNEPRAYEVIQKIKLQNSKLNIVYIDHHKAHAGIFFLSPFKEAAILTCDGRGEHDTLTFCIGEGNKIIELDNIKFPHSIGMLYGSVTQFLGFKRDSDEWKVMALYSYCVGKENPYLSKMRKLVTLLPEGKFELDLTYFDYYLYDVPNFYGDKFVKEFGKPRKKEEEITERHQQIAHALQVVTEEIMTHTLNYLHEKTKKDYLVVSGGSFMNSVFNGKILKNTPFKDVFVSSCPDDSGTSIGAACYLYNHLLDNVERGEMIHNYLGPSYSETEIEDTLNKYKIPHLKIDDVELFAAKKISEGKIVGWMQGKMEFGQRALGNRSILADPRDPQMKDKINACIKYRESFRPFAPAILIEEVENYFEIPGFNKEVRFMEKVYPIKQEVQKLIPAVTHIDGSGRLQTVKKEHNPRFHKLISEFRNITNVPIVLNTSFNLNGEPIVCSPTDAIRTFYSCGMDILIMGDYVIEK